MNKGNSYNNLNDSFIIFICLFDIIGKNRPVYTFENTDDKELKDFLTYLKTGKANNEFTREIETMIQTVKQNEQARQEYRLLSTFEMDINDKAEYRVKRETAKNMKLKNFDTVLIKEITGLSEAEIEKL